VLLFVLRERRTQVSQDEAKRSEIREEQAAVPLLGSAPGELALKTSVEEKIHVVVLVPLLFISSQV
jgi:hypothetical protein